MAICLIVGYHFFLNFVMTVTALFTEADPISAVVIHAWLIPKVNVLVILKGHLVFNFISINSLNREFVPFMFLSKK